MGRVPAGGLSRRSCCQKKSFVNQCQGPIVSEGKASPRVKADAISRRQVPSARVETSASMHLRQRETFRDISSSLSAIPNCGLMSETRTISKPAFLLCPCHTSPHRGSAHFRPAGLSRSQGRGLPNYANQPQRIRAAFHQSFHPPFHAPCAPGNGNQRLTLRTGSLWFNCISTARCQSIHRPLTVCGSRLTIHDPSSGIALVSWACR
ncbi:hypothetical protein B0I35DRAFT_43073 [Stachybotrys elegans]|uniref:Uncharacterized protein n=1 Tax=Stachybotrys elegans TaxID=80388 RepID=A0A8K0T3T8_9HYPO|nr:hypothetical protein B0I35DRAFT_43073 [Stachybotrys elegans]